MRIKLLLSFIVLFATGVFAYSPAASAATLFISPPSAEVGTGDKLTLDIKIDSEGVGLNAAQAVIRFPNDILEATGLDKTGSAFSFWLEEPNFSNADGVISFIGGIPYGVTGGSIQVLKVTFTAKGTGSGSLTVSDAAVTASDGSGTNILSKTVSASFMVVPKKVVPPTPVPAPVEVVPPPVEIVRKPVPTGKLPVKPALNIQLYPDETRWYNLTSVFNVAWELPLDVTGITTALNNQPNYVPPKKSEGLFENKAFPSLADGVQYLHVHFQNNVGWGPAAHYRLAVDTQPPLPFDISAIEGESSDSPTPTLQFGTNDALSGLKEYQIRIGDGELIKVSAADYTGIYALPILTPGKRQVIVKAVDNAENGIEDSITIETLPIASPIITFVTQELFSEETRGLNVKGTSLPDIKILFQLYTGEALIAEGATSGDEMGNWEFTFDQPLRNGDYKVTAQSRDARGALSLVVDSPSIKVKSKPIIQIGPLQLGRGGAIGLLLFVLLAGFGGGVWFYKKRQKKLALRVSFAEAEITKIFQLLKADAERLLKARETPTAGNDVYAIQRLQENIQKMENYIKKGVEKIKK
ncbi:MAG: hypothetical protein UX56_C0016G0010 [Candidatus Azambacteria bacterium GW2011_GWD2_46_48]|uniref:Cohesin domain-containing protein n=2 Tax=Candidatus Azamiibacteriota TaxID=1752741 RepID=A0A0G1Q9W5_9BACT|nr:MAG: hypothetical protein UX48_C0024G0002 [Candidatus Azambacteria bacterium GW2011_GWB1_46_27]KKU41774.1 MAG: hypothetical protein UX56_C0016G0010 [Candidatus Azambacteria bacterium GW2011_GWD2_46_48]